MTVYVHHTPGRLRLKAASIKDNHKVMTHMHDVLQTLEGLQRIKMNPTTGSIVIHYDEHAVFHWQILHLLKENGYFNPSAAKIADPGLNQSDSPAGAAIGKALINWTVGKALDSAGLSFLAAFI